MKPLSPEIMGLIVEVIRQDHELSKIQGLPTDPDQLQHEFHIDYQIADDIGHIELAPVSGEGHDYLFTFDAETYKVLSLVVGELEPEADEDDS